LPEVRRLNKEVNSQSPSKAWLVFDLELAVFSFSIVERPCIQPRVHKRYRAWKVNQRTDSKR